MNKLTPKQRKANARNQLFRQIHGFCISHFINTAIRAEALTTSE